MNNVLMSAKERVLRNNIDLKIVDYYYKYLIDNNEYDELTFNKGIDRLINGEPIQYIIGNVDFLGNIINVDKNVLIPRFETEELVIKTVKYIQKYLDDKISIIDLGTGSGCIAISIKKLLPNVEMTGIDISNEALEVAKNNAKNNKVDINFYLYDMTKPVGGKYDVIISNPPYIDNNDNEVMDIVRKNEPHIALYASNNGLYFYEKILENATNILNEKSIVALEIGYNQSTDIINIAKKYFKTSTILCEKDMSNKNRFIFIINNV